MKRVSLANQLISILTLPFNVVITVPLVLVYLEELYLRFHKFTLLGIVLIIGGLLLLVNTIWLLINIGRGTLAPWNPTRKLVIVGPYRYVRNPMISGVVLILLGESIVFMSKYICIWLIVFFLINYVYFIIVEEPGLVRRFGKEYVTYKQKVPRWIPRLRSWGGDED